MLMNSFNKSIRGYKFLKMIPIIFCLLIDIPKLYSHYKGIYKSEDEAILKAKELGCEGAFKIGDLWMPCVNEKVLHEYLMKN